MNIQQQVKRYYGKTLTSSEDLKTDACCTAEAPPPWLRAILNAVHPEVSAKYYGCGLIAPLALEGRRVLDLGCGAGRDTFVLSALVGEHGSVVGVDITPEQLAVATAHRAWHARRFGFARSNVEFVEGDIARLEEIGLERDSFDVIVSNCVINLVEDKRAVFEGARALLKSGGEFYFSDVYADRRLPPDLKHDPVAYGECLAGALYWNDFLQIAKQAGFHDPRLASDRPIAVADSQLKKRLGAATFHSATFRLFNVSDLEPSCEDYGQAVIYKGGIDEADDIFFFDAHHRIEKGRIFPVCGNTYRILSESRFAPYFDFLGDWSAHYGIFPGCGTLSPFGRTSSSESVSGSCC